MIYNRYIQSDWINDIDVTKICPVNSVRVNAEYT